jgi:hypothetical protein
MRMQPLLVPLVLAASTLTSVAGGAHPGAHPGARPGEAFTFKFSVGPIEGGRARMSIGKPTAERGRRVIWAHGQAETTAFIKLLARVEDDYTVAVDTGSLLPLRVRETERGMRERKISAVLDGRNAEVDYWSPERQHKGKRMLPRIVRDPLSGFFALRAMALENGQKIGLDVLDGAALWRAALTVKRGEKLRVDSDPAGSPARAAIRIDGVATRIDDAGRPRGTAPRSMIIFLSDDADRVLLRLEADTELGRAALELTSYQPAARVTQERTPTLPGIEIQ